MNKKVSIVLAIVYGIIVIGLIVGLILLISNNFSFSNFGGSKVKLIEEQEFEKIGKLNINTKTADIYIKQSSNNMVKVEIYSSKEDKANINNTEEALTISHEQDSCFFLCWFRKSKINVYLPSNYENDINIKATTGDIEIGDFSSSNAYIKVTTGDVKISSINKADVKASTGDINITNVNELTTDLSTGDVLVNKVNGYLNLSSSTGDVTISNVNLTKNSNIKTTTGDVKISTLNDVYVEANTSTGDTRINNNNRKSDLELKIKTSTGDIDVN